MSKEENKYFRSFNLIFDICNRNDLDGDTSNFVEWLPCNLKILVVKLAWNFVPATDEYVVLYVLEADAKVGNGWQIVMAPILTRL